MQELNHQLSKHNIKITEVVIVDATLVESHARPRKKEIIETEPVGDEDVPGQIIFQYLLKKLIRSGFTHFSQHFYF